MRGERCGRRADRRLLAREQGAEEARAGARAERARHVGRFLGCGGPDVVTVTNEAELDLLADGPGVDQPPGAAGPAGVELRQQCPLELVRAPVAVDAGDQRIENELDRDVDVSRHHAQAGAVARVELGRSEARCRHHPVDRERAAIVDLLAEPFADGQGGGAHRLPDQPPADPRRTSSRRRRTHRRRSAGRSSRPAAARSRRSGRRCRGCCTGCPRGTASRGRTGRCRSQSLNAAPRSPARRTRRTP